MSVDQHIWTAPDTSAHPWPPKHRKSAELEKPAAAAEFSLLMVTVQGSGKMKATGVQDEEQSRRPRKATG